MRQCSKYVLRFVLQIATAVTLSAAASDGVPSPEPITVSPVIRVDHTPVAGGGEITTYLGKLTDSGDPVPLVSVLRDTMGDADPANDQFRYVWAYGYKRPTLWQRFSATIPFLYRRAGLDRRSKVEPISLLDMAAPAKGAIPKMLGTALQSSVLDPLGAPLRAATRSYRERIREYRAIHVWRSIETLRSTPVEAGGFSGEDLARIEGRLLLSNQVLGGYVSDDAVPAGWSKRQNEWALSRAHNWELLRQRAEDSGLYFQPLSLAGEDPQFALLWVERDPAAPAPSRKFDGQFLKISDPYRDDRLRNWKGYTEPWCSTANSCTVMIPLALYALDHPRAPLLLVDFRDSGRPKHREMAMRFSDDLATGVLGLTGFGHWPYLAAKSTWFFIHRRHGAALDREARVRAYVQLRQSLIMGYNLDPPLREELMRRTEKLGLNPFEDDASREVQIARAQYAKLLSEANGKLSRELERERSRELTGQLHSPAARFGFRLTAISTFGIVRHHEAVTPPGLALIDAARRAGAEQRAGEVLSLLPPAPTSMQAGGGQ
jgi:hypothetical protein